MAIELNDNIKVVAPKPSDPRYFKASNVPWSSTAEVNANIPSTERHRGLTVNINGVEYWYKVGILDANLINKVSVLTSTDVRDALGYTPEDAANKYKTTVNIVANVPLSVTHPLSSTVITSFFIHNNSPIMLGVTIINANTIQIDSNTSLTGVSVLLTN
jgi:hypothetical protein